MIELNGLKINPSAITFNGKSISELQYNGIKVWPENNSGGGEEAEDEVFPQDNEILFVPFFLASQIKADPYPAYVTSTNYEYDGKKYYKIVCDKPIEDIDYTLFYNQDIEEVVLPPKLKYWVQLIVECKHLTKIVLSKNTPITILDNYFANGCPMLKEIKTLPNTITDIKDFAIARNPLLEKIYYDGTIQQWKQINKDKYAFFGVPSTCKVICTDGETTLE